MQKFKQRRSLKYLFTTRVMFLSIGKFWKGVYIHFVPKKTHRIFWANGKLQHDSRTKCSKQARYLMEMEQFNREQSI